MVFGLAQSDVTPVNLVDGRYLLESELGRGGMGVVYRATDTWLGRPVALKVIGPGLAKNPAVAASFLREAQALASVRSQHVVQVYAFGPYERSYFFAMEYISGRNLRQIIAEHRAHGDAVPVHRALTILTHIAEGIDAVHGTGIIHRDVKPSNIVIEEDTGRPVLVDFGLAAPSDDASARLTVGTPHYMAPEQTRLGAVAGVITARTDIYALGCTAFEVLTGQLPFQSNDRAELLRMHATSPAPRVSSIKPELAPFDREIARALSKAPEDRYPNCAEMALALTAAGTRWSTGRLTSRPPPLPIERNAPLRVLVVDDDPAFRKIAAQAVQLAYFQYRKDVRLMVIGAASGEEALEHAEVAPPDLVLLDYDMPGLDGADTLSRLRALPGGERARVVVLSDRIGAEHRWRFSVLGVRAFVNKPIVFTRLVESLRTIAERLGHNAADRLA
jgi:eukaryotic-like serine/threonine-protein kinase